jgi:molecular chaperone GrpE
MELISCLNSTKIMLTKEYLVVRPDSDEEKSETIEVDEKEELKKALTEEKNKSETNLAGWQRAQADFINYKRFAEQDKAETSKYANINLLANILPVIDDFDRAIAAIPPEQSDSKWVEGLKLIDRKLKDTLQKQGVTYIKAEGEEFDPYLMEAISRGKGKKDIVIQELEKGYKLHDKVIRPAKVIVGSGEEETKKEEAE